MDAIIPHVLSPASATAAAETQFNTLLIVDDMAHTSDATNSLRQYYERMVNRNIVRTLDEYELRYTPCVVFSLNASHEHEQYHLDTRDHQTCVASWGLNADGSSARPVWKAGYFVVSQYI